MPEKIISVSFLGYIYLPCPELKGCLNKKRFEFKPWMINNAPYKKRLCLLIQALILVNVMESRHWDFRRIVELIKTNVYWRQGKMKNNHAAQNPGGNRLEPCVCWLISHVLYENGLWTLRRQTSRAMYKALRS